MKSSLLLAGAAMIGLSGAAHAQMSGVPAGSGEPASTAGSPATSEPTGAAPATPSDAAAPADAPSPASDTAASSAATQPTDAATAAQTPSDAPAAPGAAPAQQATAVPATAADPAKSAAAQQTVQAGWATYDKGNKGSLTPLEFGTWVMAAGGQDMTAQVDKTRTGKAKNLPAVKVLNATAEAFSKADANKDRAISPDELTAFLSA